MTVKLEEIKAIFADFKKKNQKECSENCLNDLYEFIQRKETITLKSIDSFVCKSDNLTESYKFVIKEYQRGYRWTKNHVEGLLNDINNFSSKNSFYCLQPVVVSRDVDNYWELIDGQQRITTIFLILKYLRIREKIDNGEKIDNSKEKYPFEIIYETRTGSKKFIEDIDDIINRDIIKGANSWKKLLERNTDYNNIDNFNFYEALRTINDWFENNMEQNEEKKIEWRKKLLKHTKVIWYKVPNDNDNNSPTEIFNRINKGKISLTNSELVKALFLSQPKNNDGYKKRLEIAREWEDIENTLQRDEFWFFIKKGANTTDSCRIDFIFSNILESKQKENKIEDKISNAQYAIFDYYFNELNKNNNEVDRTRNISNLWQEVKKCFYTFYDWYSNYELYHRIGFLVNTELEETSELFQKAKGKSKIEFKKDIKDLIKKGLFTKAPTLEELRYDEHREIITKLLLLFNIETLIDSNKTMRFPFKSYSLKTGNINKSNERNVWTLEHIHAQNSKAKLPDNADIDSIKLKLNKNDKDGFDKLKLELEGKNDEDKSEKLMDYCYKKLGDLKEDGDEIHRLGNLALLEKDSNSKLSNNYFFEKREKIIKMDKNGEFIPPATKNVFFKYYTEKVVQLNYWSDSNRADYFKKIKKTFVKKEYIENPSSEGENNE